MTIGGLIRNGKGMLVKGDTLIQPGDHVLVFCLSGAIRKLKNVQLTFIRIMLFQRTNTINLRAILRLLGILLLFEAAFMLPALAVSICYNETKSIESFLISIAITAGCGCRRLCFLPKTTTWGNGKDFC